MVYPEELGDGASKAFLILGTIATEKINGWGMREEKSHYGGSFLSYNGEKAGLEFVSLSPSSVFYYPFYCGQVT